MPVVSFSIGSFGDIVTILQLAWQLRAALSSASGASTEVAALISDLDEFTRGLQQVNALISRGPACLQPDIVNGIRHALGTCHDVLLAAERKIPAFRSRMRAPKGPRHDHGTLQVRAAKSDARLEQIYALLQELPGQVTVASPAFRPFGAASNRYYQPCARTSYKRLQELVVAANKQVNPALEFGLQKDVYLSARIFPNPDVAHMFYIRAAKMGPQDEDFPDSVTLGSSVWAPAVPVQCFFFKGVFNEWQVMLGVPPQSATVEYQQLLQVLLERKHAIGAPCDCDGAHCRVRFAGLVERAVYIKRALLSYSEVGTLLLAHVPEEGDGSYWRERILAALRAYPDPEYIRGTILPFLWKMDVGQSTWVEETTGEQDETVAGEASLHMDGDTTCRDTEPQWKERIHDATATEDEEPPTEEASTSESEMGYYSLDEMVSGLETAPGMRDDTERLDFSFTIHDLRSHSRIVTECRNIAFQKMMLF